MKPGSAQYSAQREQPQQQRCAGKSEAGLRRLVQQFGKWIFPGNHNITARTSGCARLRSTRAVRRCLRRKNGDRKKQCNKQNKQVDIASHDDLQPQIRRQGHTVQHSYPAQKTTQYTVFIEFPKTCEPHSSTVQVHFPTHALLQCKNQGRNPEISEISASP